MLSLQVFVLFTVFFLELLSNHILWLEKILQTISNFKNLSVVDL